MIITPHVVVGYFIAATVQSRYLKNNKTDSGRRMWFTIIALSFASHFLLDALPHYDYNIYDVPYTGEIVTKLVPDVFLAFYFISAICRYVTGMIDFFYKLFLPLYASGFAAILPDIINGIYRFGELWSVNNVLLQKFINFHSFVHTNHALEFGWGMTIYAAMVVVLFLKTKSVTKESYNAMLRNARIEEMGEQIGREIEEEFRKNPKHSQRRPRII